mmetsp:Transcript_21129/g.41069  ORF Transcript_21129/g.41069 Transcript_21129/m.41069 type:complete len:277 (+) Transcript_21129:235-1065(+)
MVEHQLEAAKTPPEDEEMDHDVDELLGNSVKSHLFDDRPLTLNSLFRFQLGSNAFDGYEFAREAWKRVTDGTAQPDQCLAGLRQQKETVKRELKLFEVQFAKFYGRPPSRLDKECLRRLYEFHKQLKSYISAEESKLDGHRSPSPVPTSNLPPVSVSGSIISVPPKPDLMSAPLGTINRIGSSGGHIAKEGASKQRGDTNDLRVLKAEKRALKIKLRRFEDDFIRHNGHKPQSYQEVGNIRSDYTRYKFLKEAVANSERSERSGENNGFARQAIRE